MAFSAPESDLDAKGFVAPSVDLGDEGFVAPSADVNDPSLAQVGSGLVADIAVAEGAKYATATAGSALGPLGTVGGYIAGAVGGGISGSLLAQKIEGRDEVDWGRVVGDTLINFIPGSKLAKGGSFAARAGKAAVRQGAAGAVIAPGAEAVQSYVNDGEIPAFEKLRDTAVRGAALGAGLGGASVGIERLAKKVGGRSTNKVNEMVAEGDLTFKDFEFITKDKGGLSEGFLRRELEETAQRKQSEMAAAEILRSKEISAKGLGRVGQVLSSMVPSRFVGRRGNQAAIDYKRNVIEAEELGSRIAKNIEKRIGRDEGLNKLVNRAIDGEVLSKENEALLRKAHVWADIEKFQDTRLRLQEKLTQLLDEGAYGGLDNDARRALRQTLQDSIAGKSYNRRDYQMFLNKEYKPDEKLERAAFNELSEKLGADKAKAHMDRLKNASARTKDADPRSFFGSGVDSILKRKHNPGGAERAWLGEITEAPERIRGTLSGLGRSTARAEADMRIGQELLSAGIGAREQTGDMVELVLRGTGPEGTGIYVNPEVQTALNQIYLPKADRGMDNIVLDSLQDLYRASVSGSKAAKVLLNTVAYPVQLYGNTATLIGMGINPFRGATRGLDLALSEFGGIERLRKAPEARRKLLDEIQEMSRYGLKGTNILDSDIRSSLDKGIFSQTLGKLIDPVGKAYSVPDTMGRYVGWKANQRTLRKIFPEASDETIKRQAAHLINDTYQNYDKLSNVVRTLSRWGVIPQFASFTAEFARNQYNQGRVIAQMLSGRFGADMAQELGKGKRGAMLIEGSKRFAALSAVYGGTYGLIEGIKRSDGVDEHDEEALRDLAFADWDKNRQLLMHFDKQKRNGWLANPSYLIPHAIGISALKAGIDGQDETSVASLVAEELVGEGSFIALEAFRAIDNRDKSGREITNELDGLKAAQDRLKYFIIESFRPGVSRELKKAAEAKQGKGDLTLKEVGQRQLGFRKTAFDLTEFAERTIRTNYQAGSRAKSSYYSDLKYDEPSAEKANALYETANRINRESFDALDENNRSLQVLGYSEDERIKIMKAAGVRSTTIIDVLSGSYRDMPRVQEKTTADIYSDLPSGRQAKLREIRKFMRADRETGNKLMETFKRESKRSNMSERDLLFKRMSIDDRVRYLRQNPALLSEWRQKGIATDSVLEKLRQ